jgi:glycosyltransferase involved in cell wall biosynthesis
VHIKGKFFYDGTEKFYIRGVTYGTFRPREDGYLFPDREVVRRDFALMARHGFNCVRVYTVPPLYLLDLASEFHLKVMVGLPWEQHIAFLDDKAQPSGILKRIAENVTACAKHNAIFCYVIGNEIPASIVRWYGKKRIENFLRQAYDTVKAIEPDALVTYVNYPTTEYLDLSYFDFDCFNVYLETPEKLSAYISRLHNLTTDRPLVLAEIGLDSRRNGELVQADTLTWQIRTIFAKGCAGMFVFSWTDEWWRGGSDILDWDFGLTDRDRHPKPALYAAQKAMNSIPVAVTEDFPFISVVVCSYNGSRTIRDCMEGLQKLQYPYFEVIVVNDGSTDNFAEIVREYPVKLISTHNAGLSSARNTGMQHARGEIIAYIDDDAYPDPHWLHYLGYAFRTTTHACIGGPNILPPEDGPIATCVANAPGGPVHVLTSDEIAEHVPGCNLSIRKDVLIRIGGFDPVYRSAGDDVDICWRVQQAGHTIGFHPAALVWHHRRNSLKAYWKQQQGYGKAEALLELKWPEKYNGFGHLSWHGRIYGNGTTLPIKLKKDKIFHGTWGSALFQSVYQTGGFVNSIPLMPEWYFLTALFAIVGLLGFAWWPLLFGWILFGASLLLVVMQAAVSAKRNSSLQPHQKQNIKFKALIILLHVIQPVARLYGRFRHGLTPWRTRGIAFDSIFLFVFGKHVFTHWSEKWRSAEDWLMDIESHLMDKKIRVSRGKDFDSYDLQVRSGLFSAGQGLLAIEEHGGGKQYLRFKCRTYYSLAGYFLTASLCALAIIAAVSGEWLVAAIFGLMFATAVTRYVIETAGCLNSLFQAFNSLKAVREVPVFQKDIIHKSRITGRELARTHHFITRERKRVELGEEVRLDH